MERQGTPRSILLAAALALGLALAHGGCALTLSGPAADRPRDRPPQCDTGKGLVGLDAVLGTTMGLVTLGLLDSDVGSGLLLPVAIGTAFIASAVSGNRRVNACRKAIAVYEGDDPESLANEEEPRSARAPSRWRVQPRARAQSPRRGVMAPAAAPAAPAPAAAVPAPAAAPADVGPAPAVAAPAPASAATPPPPAPAATAPPAAPARPPGAAPAAPARPPSPAPAPSQSWVDFWRELP